MKKIISFLLVVSILSISVFGCYVQASSSGNPGNGKITEKQSKLYDKMFGSGNWYVDDDGVVHGSDDTSTKKYTKLLDNLLAQSLFPAGILGKFSEVLPLLQALYMESKDGNTVLNNWFNQYDNSINIGDDGNVSVGADAMQGFRSALSDQVYSLGSYRILEQNITPADLQNKLQDFCGKMPLSKYFTSDYNRCFSGFNDGFTSSGEYAYTDMMFYFIRSREDDLVLVQRNFDSTIKGRFNFYRYDTDKEDWVFTTLHTMQCVDGRSGMVSSPSSLSTRYIPIQYLGTDFYYYGPSLRVFSSLDDVKYYYKCLNDETYQPNVYIYNNYSPSSTTINLNNVNNYDYEKIINNAYNTINNEKNTTIKVIGSISDNDLQLIIKNAIDLAINQTGGGSGGGSGGDGGDSGGGSGGSSGTDYTGILNSILTYCKNISAVVTSSDSRIELLVGIAAQNKTLLSGISTSITDLGTSLGDIGMSVKNIEQYLKDISEQIKDLIGDDSGGGSLFDRIIDFLFRTLSNLLADLLGDVIKTIIGDLDGVTGSAKVLAGTAQSKFPTSIPWDIIAIIDVMSAEPQCPKFEIPFQISRLGIDESITIDLQKAEKVAELSRNMLTVTFLLFLVIQTRKLYGSMTKN